VFSEIFNADGSFIDNMQIRQVYSSLAQTA
jgi:hypothetical protein